MKLKEGKKRYVIAFVILMILALAALLVLVNYSFDSIVYPNYIKDQPKQTFTNSYYGIEITSYITNLFVGSQDITAYYNIFSCEENFEGDWEIELVTNQTSINDGKNTLIQTTSVNPTHSLNKVWVFNNTSSTFSLEITKTYTKDSSNINNQIIVDVENNGIYTDYLTWVAFKTKFGVFGFKIVASDCSVSLQFPKYNMSVNTLHEIGHLEQGSFNPCLYTEVQINIDGQKDNDIRNHTNDQTETIKLLVYAKVDGAIEDVKNLSLDNR